MQLSVCKYGKTGLVRVVLYSVRYVSAFLQSTVDVEVVSADA